MLNRALQEWLDVATWDLCVDAETRVRAEVEAHFDAACDALVSSGQALKQAQSTVLRSLGNPHTAAKRYKTTYITVREAALLRRISEKSLTPFAFITICLLFGVLYFVIELMALERTPAILWLASIAASVAAGFLCLKKYRHDLPALCARLSAFHVAFPLIAAGFFALPSSNPDFRFELLDIGNLAVIAIGFIPSAIRFYRLAHKLRHGSNRDLVEFGGH